MKLSQLEYYSSLHLFEKFVPATLAQDDFRLKFLAWISRMANYELFDLCECPLLLWRDAWCH